MTAQSQADVRAAAAAAAQHGLPLLLYCHLTLQLLHHQLLQQSRLQRQLQPRSQLLLLLLLTPTL